MKKSKTTKRNTVIKLYEIIGMSLFLVGMLAVFIIGAFSVRPYTIISLIGIFISIVVTFIGYLMICKADKYKK